MTVEHPYDQIVDGCHPLQDETVEKRRHGNGAACDCLQYDPRDEDHGHSGDDRGHEGVKGSVRLEIDPENTGAGQRPYQSPAQPLNTVKMTIPAENQHKCWMLKSTSLSKEFPHSLSASETSEACVALDRFSALRSLVRQSVETAARSGRRLEGTAYKAWR